MTLFKSIGTAALLLCLGSNVMSQTLPMGVGELDDETRVTYQRTLAQTMRQAPKARGLNQPVVARAGNTRGGCNIQVGTVEPQQRRGLSRMQSVTIVNEPTLCLQR